MKKLLFCILALSLAVSLAACGENRNGNVNHNNENSNLSGNQETEVITLMLATKMPEDSFEGKTYQHFADLVNEYTNGSVLVQVYPSEQLGDSTTTVTNMTLGTIDMYAEGISYYSGYTDKTAWTSVPFLIPSWEEFSALMQGEFGAAQEADLNAAGLTLISRSRTWMRGPYYVMCSTKPIETPDDLKGLRLRTHDSAAFMAAMDGVGMNPLVIAYTDTYSALQQGTVEAVICPISNVESMAFYEQAPYICKFDIYPQEITVVMNLDKFNSLTAEQQDALVRAADDTAAYSNEAIEAVIQEIISSVSGKGAVFMDDFDISPLHDALEENGYYREQVANGTIPQAVADAWLP
ncbi:MAG: TRAP transporter substrate-binding protein [Ruminococcaceae bacterium]|nr:TRAP transporter substrate-binding protein [Oscillospiraceae bacterium]